MSLTLVGGRDQGHFADHRRFCAVLRRHLAVLRKGNESGKRNGCLS